MTGEEARAAALRLHMRIKPVLPDKDLEAIATFLQEAWAEAFEAGRKNRPAPFQLREVKGLPNGRAWEIT